MNPSLLLSVLLLSLLLAVVTSRPAHAAPAPGSATLHPRLEASFRLPNLQGNPFDFTENDVKVTLAGPDGRSVTLPAFFDGGDTWRVRHTPAAPGRYAVESVTLNGRDAQPQALAPTEFNVAATTPPRFVRIDPQDNQRFVLDDGSPYYPLGYNLGWRGGDMPPLVESIAKMGQAGVNWTRIWMNHWDEKNLEWGNATPNPEIGRLKLDTAQTWDDIVEALEAHDIRFQLVLQHHGQYSTRVNPNWSHHPFNKANGGFLDAPEQFFTDPKAIALTKSKYRYIIARWGYSPAVMAWELFNEVEYTDAFENALPTVAAWHAEMAAFIREHDVYDHLVTTSSRVTEPTLWPAMDYYQAHIYPPDVVTAVVGLDERRLDRAYFYGEIGSSTASWKQEKGHTLHQALWASLVSQAGGAAQYWYWDNVEPNNLFFHYSAAQAFVEASGLPNQRGMKAIDVVAQTPDRGPLRFGPGLGWEKSQTTEFTALPTGKVAGLGGMSGYLQGDNNRAMFPAATLNVEFPTAGTFAVRLDEAAKDGAALAISVDGKLQTTLTIDAAPEPQQPAEGPRRERENVRLSSTIEVPVAAGSHVIRLENTGKDWVHLREFALTPYAYELAALGKANDELAVIWVYRREPGEGTIAGTLSVPGLRDGDYRVAWWDTTKGQVVGETAATVSGGAALPLATPPISHDIAAWIQRVE